MTSRPPLPPFTQETAVQKVRLAEDGWNTRNPQKVSLAYTVDSHWRNRAEFINGRRADRGIPRQKMDEGARLPAYQGVVGIHRQSYCGAVCL